VPSRRLAALTLALLLAAPAPADDDPVFNGRKMTEWLTMLKEDSLPRKRRAAVLALGQLAADNGEPKGPIDRILPALARALRSDANPGVRTQAAVVLGQQSADNAPLFLSDLSEVIRVERDGDARREMAVALGRFGPLSRPAVVPLADVLKDPAAPTRAAAAEALGRIGADARQAVPQLIPLLKDADPAVRRAAAFALGRVDPEDPEPVSTALTTALVAEQGAGGRIAAASAAGSSGLWAMRRDGGMVTELIISLGLLGDRSAEVVQAVAGQLTDPAADVRQQAALSLAKFGPAARPAADPLTGVFRSDPDKLTRMYALHTLCTSHGSEANTLIPVLTDRLKADPDFEVRVAIAEELGAMGRNGAAAIPALRDAQRDPQIKVREAAGAAIRQINKPPEKGKP
jgi:HEAT repeat protein